jgi:hypothetical protein
MCLFLESRFKIQDPGFSEMVFSQIWRTGSRADFFNTIGT